MLSDQLAGTVANVNDPPTISGPPSTLVLYVGTPFNYAGPTFSDPDSSTSAGEVLTLTPSFDPVPSGWLTFDSNTGALTGTPQTGDDGLLKVTITVSDDGTPPLTDNLTFTLDIRDTSSVTVSWDPVTSRVNGDPLPADEIDHYEVSYAISDATPTTVSVAPAAPHCDYTALRCNYTTPKLAPGTYTFMIKAIDHWSLDSGYTAGTEGVVPTP